MAMRVRESLVANPPAKIYTPDQLVYLLPYFRGEKTLAQIAQEIGKTKAQVEGWVKNNLREVKRLLDERDDAYRALQNRVDHISATCSNKLFSDAFYYQQCVVGELTIEDLVLILKKDSDTIRNDIERLYGQVTEVLTKREGLINLHRANRQQGGQS
jgi:hypothetical protein